MKYLGKISGVILSPEIYAAYIKSYSAIDVYTIYINNIYIMYIK